MREDMWKVIVERPRWDSGREKGGARRRDHDEDSPARELRAERARGRSKGLNENLAPLRRFLAQNVGRPWNAVLAEVCAVVRLDSTVQRHVREHLEDDLVQTRVLLRDGVACYAPPHFFAGRPLSPRVLYVCPRTGLLRRPRPPRVPALRPVVTRIELAGARSYELLEGGWFEVEWAALGAAPLRDVVRRRVVEAGREGASAGDRVPVRKRQCGGKALRAIRRSLAGEPVPGLRPVVTRLLRADGGEYVREHGGWRRLRPGSGDLGWPERADRRAIAAALRER